MKGKKEPWDGEDPPFFLLSTRKKKYEGGKKDGKRNKNNKKMPTPQLPKHIHIQHQQHNQSTHTPTPKTQTQRLDKTQQHDPLHTLHRTIQQNLHPNVEPILTNNPNQPKHQKGEQSCCSLNSNSTPLLFQISKNKYHYVRAVQRNFFIVHPILPKAALAPNYKKTMRNTHRLDQL